jgi:glycosyltransferase involved in cell wall biosynthesis
MIKKSESEIMKNWPKEEKPVVTICCIAYNHEKLLENTIDSFLMQKTDFPFEIIIHDDASTDNTVKIIQKYVSNYPGIVRAILQKENQFSQGVRVRPFIFRKARGDYMALCDGDDYWTDSQKLQKQLTAMRAHPECYISFHAVKEVLDDGKGTLNPKPYTPQRDKDQIFTPEEVVRGGGYFMQTSSIMIKREITDNLPDFYYKAPAEDYMLQFLGSINGGALYINEEMAVYLAQAGGSWTVSVHKNEEKMMNYLEKLVQSYISMNDYLDGRYEKDIMPIVNEKSRILAGYYYKEKKYEKLKNYKNISLGYQIIYLLRNYPVILDFIIKIKIAINKFLFNFRT